MFTKKQQSEEQMKALGEIKQDLVYNHFDEVKVIVLELNPKLWSFPKNEKPWVSLSATKGTVCPQ